MENNRRRTPRYPFTASIEMREGASEDKRAAHVSELGLNGCYVNTEGTYPTGTSLGVKIFTETEFFEAQASVVYTRPNKGMGLMFKDTKPFFVTVLRRWLLSAMMASKRSSS